MKKFGVSLSLMFAMLLGAVGATLSGCASVGLPTADSFNERLAVGYASVTTIRQTATALLQAKKISADDGQQVLDQTNNARQGLDIARTLSKTNLAAADGKLTAIRTALNAVQTYLAARQRE